MVILIGNQKGGVGKSTLALLLGNYLTQIRGRKVTIVDMDYQQSLYTKSQKARILENAPFYQIIPSDLKSFPSLLRALDPGPDELVLIDLPGKMGDDGLLPLFAAADVVLCPFSYDEFSIDSTVLFAMVLRKINERSPLIFIPNRIKSTVKYETRNQVEKVMQHFGVLSPALADRIDFQRISTFRTPLILYPLVLPMLELVYGQYLQWQGNGQE